MFKAGYSECGEGINPAHEGTNESALRSHD
jgi:hypothetical protein